METIPAQADGLPNPARTLAFTAVLIAFNLSVMMGSITNVALPTIAENLNITASDAIWVVNIYQLAVVLVLLPISALADQIGFRPLYLAGLALFVVGAAISGLSHGFAQLLAGRALQGIGSAAIQGVYIAAIAKIFPRKLIGRGVAMGTLTSNVAGMAAPSIAAMILLIADWQWLFLVVLPFGVAAFWISSAAMPKQPPPGDAPREPFPWNAAILNVITFALLAIGLEGVLRADQKWLWALVVLAGFGVGAIQIRLQRDHKAPIIPVDLFRISAFSFTMAGSLFAFAASTITLISLPFLLQGPLGLSTQKTGLVLTVWPIFTAASGFLTGWLFDKVSPSRIGALGMAIMAAGLIGLGVSFSYQDSLIPIVLFLAITGIGFGIFVTPNVRAIILITPGNRSGAASGMQAVSRLFGQVIGAIIVAIALADNASGTSGSQGLVVAAALAVIAAVMSALRRIDITSVSEGTPVAEPTD